MDDALRTVFDRLSIEPPAYLPVVHPTQGGKVETPPPRGNAAAPASLQAVGALSPLLSSPLLSGVLLAFTVDFEADARIARAIGANTLRVLDDTGTRVGDLPPAGVAREGSALCAGWLERRGCSVTEPGERARRGKMIRLTPKGQKAQQNLRRPVDATEQS